MEKLIRFLKALYKTELPLLQRFLTQKKINPTLIKLCDYLIQYYPNYENLDKEKIVTAILDTNGKPLTIKQLQTNASKLAALIEPFFVQQEIATEPYLQERLMIIAFAKRGLYEEFRAATLELTNKLEQMQNPDVDHFYLLFKLYQDLFFHPYTETFQREATLLDKSVVFYNKFNLLVALRLLSESLVRQQIYDLVNASLSTESIPHIPAHYTEPIFRIYHDFLKILQQREPTDSIIIFKNDLERNIHFLNDLDRSSITQKFVHRLYYFYEWGRLDYLPHIYELYQLADQHNFTLYNKTLSHLTYMNIIATAAGVGKFEWATYFMNKYLPFLSPDIAKDAHIFAQASYFFFLPDYDNTLTLLDKLLYDHVAIRLQAEMLYLRTYYELIIKGNKDETEFDKCVDRLRTYLQKSNKVPFSTEREVALKNFISFIKKMIHYHYIIGKKEKDKQKLLAEFANSSPMYSRGWIYKKITDLK